MATTAARTHCATASILTTQARRLAHIAARSNRLTNNAEPSQVLNDNWHNLCTINKRHRARNGLQQEDSQARDEACDAYLEQKAACNAKLISAAGQLEKRAHILRYEARKIAAHERKVEMEDKSYGLGTVSKHTGRKLPQPLSDVKRDKTGSKGDPPGTYVTSTGRSTGYLEAPGRRCIEGMSKTRTGLLSNS